MPVPRCQWSPWRTETNVFRLVRHGRCPGNYGNLGFDEIAWCRGRVFSRHTRESVLRSYRRTRMSILSSVFRLLLCLPARSKIPACGPDPAARQHSPGTNCRAILRSRFAYTVPGITPANDGAGVWPSMRAKKPASLRDSIRRKSRRARRDGDFRGKQSAPLWARVSLALPISRRLGVRSNREI